MQLKNFLILTLSLVSFYCASSTAYILDTGPGPINPASGFSLYNYGNLDDQFLAVKFVVSADVEVASIEGWMTFSSGIGSSGTIALYDDNNGLPGIELYSTAFETAGTGLQGMWEGSHNLSWELSAGTYFAAIEVRDGQTLDAVMPEGVPNPAPESLFFNSSNNRWNSLGIDIGNDIGFRISPVPLPMPLLLLASAMGVLTWHRRVSL